MRKKDRKTRTRAVGLLLGIALLFTPAWGMTAEAAPEQLSGSVLIRPTPKASPAPSKRTPSKRPTPQKNPHGDAKDLGKDMGKNVWFLQNGPRPLEDSVLTRGVSGHTLTQKRTVQNRLSNSGTNNAPGVDTHQAIDTALKDLTEYERILPLEDASAEGKPLQKKGITGKVRTESSTWRNPVTEPVRVDQDVAVTRRNIVGAYASVVDDENLRVTLGPELSIDTENSGGNHIATPRQSEPNALGLGMKFQWDF